MERRDYTEDEKNIIRAISAHIRRDDYRRIDEDYLFDLQWSEILTEPIDQYDRLLQALESLRRRNFDSYTKDTTTLNGYIMRAKLNKIEQNVKLLISAELVLQLLADYQDDVNENNGPAFTLEELKQMVRVG